MFATRGLRHLALRVSDLARSKDFYQRVFGMTVVWQPDPDNVYLTSGCDNLALHRSSALPVPGEQRLDHIGFIVPSLEALEAGYTWAQQAGLDIVHPLRRHRDGSSSFYIRDPDGVVIQLLYEPTLSPLGFHPE